MKVESSFIFEIWEAVRDFVPAARRTETAVSILRSCEEFGLESNDLVDILDEDDALTAAFKIVFGLEEDEDEDDERYED